MIPPAPNAAPSDHGWWAPWYALVAAAAALPLGIVLASGRTLAWRDTARLFAPMRAPIVDALRHLRLPLWNPHEALGVPLFAQMMHGVLHPVSIAAAFLAPDAGVDPLIVAHVVLGALGATVLARQLGASPAAAAVGGLGYGLSGYVLGMSAVIQYLGAAGTAPWTIAALRAAGSRGGAGIAAGAVALAALVFAGDPQWAMVAVALGALLAMEAGGRRGLARAAGAVALGTALGAVQLLPTWACFRETVRSAGLGSEERLQWALAPWRMLELVLPGFFAGRPGPPEAPVFQQLGGPTQYPIPFAPSVFVGAVVLALAAAGARASRAARALAVAAAVLLWLALGAHLGADQALRWVPVWGDFRYAEKLVGPLTLCLAVLAALGADRIALRPRPPAMAGTAGVAACALAAAAVGALALWPGGGPAAFVRERLAVGALHASAALGLLAFALAAARRPAIQRRFPAIAAGLVFLQSAAAAPFALHAGARDARDPEPLREIRSPGLVPRVAVATGSILAVGPDALDPWDRLVAIHSRMGEPPYGVPSGLDHLATYTGLVPRRFGSVDAALRRDFGPAAWAALRRFGLTHVVVNDVASLDPDQAAIARAACEGGRPVLQDRDWRFSVCEVPGRPWAIFADAAVPASEGDAYPRLADLLASGGPGVVVEGPVPPRLSPGRVLATRREAERVRIEAESEGDGLLVVNDAYWPGWLATLDGRPVPILPADAVVRAVPWPAGRHLLEMSYRPPELRAGLWIAAAGLVVLLGVVVHAWRGNAGRRTETTP